MILLGGNLVDSLPLMPSLLAVGFLLQQAIFRIRCLTTEKMISGYVVLIRSVLDRFKVHNDTLMNPRMYRFMSFEDRMNRNKGLNDFVKISFFKNV